MKYILLFSLFFISPFSLAEETTTEPTEAQALYEQGMEYLGWFPNFRKAIPLLEKSARLGYAEAQVVIGQFYAVGLVAKYFRGVRNKKSILNDSGRAEDVRQARYWFEKAGNQGDAEIQYRVGLIMHDDLYYDREKNLEDKNRALHWLQQSADQGHKEAIDLLSEINSADE